MNIKPGDLFEWVYRGNNTSVRKGEELYSYTMSKWISADGLCLCVGMNNDTIYWVSDKGLFHVCINKTMYVPFAPTRSSEVIPCKL